MSVLKDGFWRDRERRESLETDNEQLRARVKTLGDENFDLRARLAAVEAELARRPPPLEWTKEPPKASGQFWVHVRRGTDPFIVYWIPGFHSMPSDGEWAGPIPEPREPEGGRDE